MKRLADRKEAGRMLAQRLESYRGREDALVVALPRGGVVVGAEVARALGLPLDILLVRKLGVPAEPELAMGAIASGGHVVLNREVIDGWAIPAVEVAGERALEERELVRREMAYRAGRERMPVAGRTVIVVDDGVATGATMEVALAALRAQGARRLVVAAAVAQASVVGRLELEADEVVVLSMPARLGSISEWFDDFEQVTDDEVRALLVR